MKNFADGKKFYKHNHTQYLVDLDFFFSIIALKSEIADALIIFLPNNLVSKKSILASLNWSSEEVNCI